MTDTHPDIALLTRFDPANVAATADILSEGFFQKMHQRTAGAFKVNPVSITAAGNELVVVHTKNTMVLVGQSIEVDAVVVWRIVDGRIVEHYA